MILCVHVIWQWRYRYWQSICMNACLFQRVVTYRVPEYAPHPATDVPVRAHIQLSCVQSGQICSFEFCYGESYLRSEWGMWLWLLLWWIILKVRVGACSFLTFAIESHIEGQSGALCFDMLWWVTPKVSGQTCILDCCYAASVKGAEFRLTNSKLSKEGVVEVVVASAQPEDHHLLWFWQHMVGDRSVVARMLFQPLAVLLLHSLTSRGSCWWRCSLSHFHLTTRARCTARFFLCQTKRHQVSLHTKVVDGCEAQCSSEQGQTHGNHSARNISQKNVGC